MCNLPTTSHRKGLAAEGVVGITVARLFRRCVSTGAVSPGTACVFDETSLLSTRDFELIALLLAKLGCQMILIGDPQNQLLAISDTCFDKDLARDISESAMLKSAVGSNRLVLTECMRSDKILFDWYCSLDSAPLEDLLQKARMDFPAKVSADYHLCLSHNTRKRVPERYGPFAQADSRVGDVPVMSDQLSTSNPG